MSQGESKESELKGPREGNSGAAQPDVPSDEAPPGEDTPASADAEPKGKEPEGGSSTQEGASTGSRESGQALKIGLPNKKKKKNKWKGKKGTKLQRPELNETVTLSSGETIKSYRVFREDGGILSIYCALCQKDINGLGEFDLHKDSHNHKKKKMLSSKESAAFLFH
ncbi:unnamed protein product, partial [Darwinula stevensoni]